MTHLLPAADALDLLYTCAMQVDSEVEAKDVLAKLVAGVVGIKGLPETDARKDVRETLGYLAGYDSHETRVRVETLFGAVHPYLGSALRGPMSAAEIFAVGQRLGLSMRNEKLQ